jgi:hypothetical protein
VDPTPYELQKQNQYHEWKPTVPNMLVELATAQEKKNEEPDLIDQLDEGSSVRCDDSHSEKIPARDLSIYSNRANRTLDSSSANNDAK